MDWVGRVGWVEGVGGTRAALLRVAVDHVSDNGCGDGEAGNRRRLQRGAIGGHVQEGEPEGHRQQAARFEIRAGGDSIPGRAKRQDDDERSGNHDPILPEPRNSGTPDPRYIGTPEPRNFGTS